MSEIGIPCVFNAVASPDMMPIENVFSIVKHNFKKLRLRQILDGKMDNTKENIKIAFDNVCKYDI